MVGFTLTFYLVNDISSTFNIKDLAIILDIPFDESSHDPGDISILDPAPINLSPTS